MIFNILFLNISRSVISGAYDLGVELSIIKLCLKVSKPL